MSGPFKIKCPEGTVAPVRKMVTEPETKRHKLRYSQILPRLRAGMTLQRIADEIGVHPQTVRNYRDAAKIRGYL